MALWDVNCMLGRWPTGELAFHDVPGLLRRMDQLGIARAVVYHSRAWQYDLVAGNATLMAELAAAPAAARDRLLPCWAVVPPATGEQGTLAELGAALKEHGVRFARLFPRDHNFALAGPDAGALLALLARLGITALIDLDQTSWEEVDHICAAQPDLNLIVGRVGYRGLRRLAGVLARHLRCRLDLSYFASHQGVEWVVEHFGADRIVFGTGAPLTDGGGAVTRLMLSDLDAVEREAIGWRNLSELVALTPRSRHPALGEEEPSPFGAPSPKLGRYSSPESAAGRGEGGSAGRAGEGAVHRGQPITAYDVVDAHAHVGPWHNFFTPETDPAGMLKVMDRCGVRMAVVSSLIGVGPDAFAGNIEIRSLVCDYPTRFAGYAVFNPHHAGSLDDVARMLGEPGIIGIKIHPDTHECAVGDLAYAPLWELAAARDRPVLTHTYADSPYCDPSAFDRVSARWPQVKIILGHAGATPAGHQRAIAVAQAHPHLYLELCGSFTTGLWIRRMVAAVGAERVLYGSDFPFIDMRYGLGRVVFTGLPEADLALILAGNACRLLNLPPAS